MITIGGLRQAAIHICLLIFSICFLATWPLFAAGLTEGATFPDPVWMAQFLLIKWLTYLVLRLLCHDLGKSAR